MKEISINEIGPIRIGQVENAEAGTGCTVFLNDRGMQQANETKEKLPEQLSIILHITPHLHIMNDHSD